MSEEVKIIRDLRKTVHILSEIKHITHRANGTIWKYIKSVPVLPAYETIWRVIKGGSKMRSENDWKQARSQASNMIKDLGLKERRIWV